MARILLLSPKLPYPPDDGGRIVQWNLCQALRYNGHTIDFAGFCRDSAALAQHRDALSEVFSELLTVPKNVERQYPMDLARAIVTGTSYFVRKFTSRRLADLLRDRLQTQNYEHLLIDSAFMGPYLPVLRPYAGARTRIILRQNNVEYEILERLAARSTQPWYRWILRREARLFRRFELELIEGVDTVYMISQRDLNILAKETQRPLAVLDPLLDVDAYRPDPAVAVEPYSIVSVGNMKWPPNINGNLWFYEHVWPAVRDAFPQATLVIVGKNPPASIRRLADSRVHITGYVKDEKPFIQTAHLFIVPLLEGSGVRIKILIALAMGKRVLSTSVGCEGIDWKGLLVRDTAEEWQQAIRDAFLKPPDHDSEAVEYVRRRYDFRRSLEL